MDSMSEMYELYVGAILAFIFWAVETIFNFVIAEWKFLVLIGVLLWGFVTLAMTLEATERDVRYLRAQSDLLTEYLRKNL